MIQIDVLRNVGAGLECDLQQRRLGVRLALAARMSAKNRAQKSLAQTILSSRNRCAAPRLILQ